MDVCNERLREWRQLKGEADTIDLKPAYLQVHVLPELWRYQLVSYKGEVYALTRLKLGLISAPKIMSKDFEDCLVEGAKDWAAASSYIDDIMVDVSKVKMEDLIAHLGQFGLVTKPPEKPDEAKVLGLRLGWSQKKEFVFSRVNDIPTANQQSKRMTKREMFSLCGKFGWTLSCRWMAEHCMHLYQTANRRWQLSLIHI